MKTAVQMAALESRFGFFILMSVLAHLVFLGGMVVFPRFLSRSVSQTMTPMLVDLVAPVPSASAVPEEVYPQPRVAADPAPFPPQVPPRQASPPEKVHVPMAEKKAEAVAPRPEPASVPVKRPQSSQRTRPPADEINRNLLETAMEDIARQVEEGGSQSLQRAFQDLERDVAERPRRQGRAGAGSDSLRGEIAGRVLDLYIAQAAHRVQQNWAYAGAGRSTEGAVVVFQITRDGRVRNLTVRQSSGNRLIDESARRAILKAEPFSAFPDTLPDDRISIGFRFTDKGVDL